VENDQFINPGEDFLPTGEDDKPTVPTVRARSSL
jgi:hypothetical protein